MELWARTAGHSAGPAAPRSASRAARPRCCPPACPAASASWNTGGCAGCTAAVSDPLRAAAQGGGGCKRSRFADRCRALSIPFHFRHLPCFAVCSFRGNATPFSLDSSPLFEVQKDSPFSPQMTLLDTSCPQQGSHSSWGRHLLARQHGKNLYLL